MSSTCSPPPPYFQIFLRPYLPSQLLTLATIFDCLYLVLGTKWHANLWKWGQMICEVKINSLFLKLCIFSHKIANIFWNFWKTRIQIWLQIWLQKGLTPKCVCLCKISCSFFHFVLSSVQWMYCRMKYINSNFFF